MNIFFLHQLPPVAASYHCDKHVGKMLIESCQLLATAHHEFGNGHNVSYRPTHKNHPSAIWVRQSHLHYMWVSDLARYLGRVFYSRYGHTHKSALVFSKELMYPPSYMRTLPFLWSNPPQAMPDEYKQDDTIAAYRNYYASKSLTMPLVYNRGKDKQPEWLRDILQTQYPMQEAA